ncbi:MAG: MFS transporter [Pseudomonadota bacterium]|nr:MFS transporter [Pseudomonadota bacterium]
MKYRHRVLILLATLSVLTYLDRVCISVAGPRIQNELHLSSQDWGLVTGAFAIAYALFEIPSGYLADRFGARAMLTRIVLWWSVFTTLTGFASKLWPLMIIRFLFGAGEAGAYPTASTSVFRWFPAVERGRVFGIVLLSSQLGGAIAPLLIVPIQVHFGWRASFYLFGVLGVAWASGWWRWYRNRPQDKTGITAGELAEIGPPVDTRPHGFPWQAMGGNMSVWAIISIAFAYSYSYYFFLFWLPTYMVRARGFTEGETKLSALPFVFGAMANLTGGFARDVAARRWGLKWGTRVIGIAGLVTSALSAFAAFSSVNNYVALAWLALCYGGITFQQPAVFATCVEIGKRNAGAVAGCMNTAFAIGGLFSSLIFGYLVHSTGSYDAVLLSMAGVLILGAAFWIRIDATEILASPDDPT